MNIRIPETARLPETVLIPKNDSIYYFNMITFIILMKPGGFEYIGLLDIIFDYGKIAVLLLTGCRYLYRGKWSPFMIVLFAHQILIGVTTLFGGGSVFDYFRCAGSILGIAMLIELVIIEEEIYCINAFGKYMVFLCVLNLFSVMILYPNGFGQTAAGTAEYLLGIDNRFLYSFVPMMGLIGAGNILNGSENRKVIYFAYVISFGVLVWFWSVGAILAYSMFIAYYFLVVKMKASRIINIWTYAAVILSAFILVVVLQEIDIFADIIVNIFNKDVTLTGRTALWDRAIELYCEYPVLGTGILSDIQLHRIFGQVTHPHNHFLYVLYTSGTVGAILFLVILCMSCKELYRFRDEHLSQFVSVCLFSIFIALLADTFDYSSGLTLLLSLAVNTKHLIRYKENCLRDLLRQTN